MLRVAAAHRMDRRRNGADSHSGPHQRSEREVIEASTSAEIAEPATAGASGISSTLTQSCQHSTLFCTTESVFTCPARSTWAQSMLCRSHSSSGQQHSAAHCASAWLRCFSVSLLLSLHAGCLFSALPHLPAQQSLAYAGARSQHRRAHQQVHSVEPRRRANHRQHLTKTRGRGGGSDGLRGDDGGGREAAGRRLQRAGEGETCGGGGRSGLGGRGAGGLHCHLHHASEGGR